MTALRGSENCPFFERKHRILSPTLRLSDSLVQADVGSMYRKVIGNRCPALVALGNRRAQDCTRRPCRRLYVPASISISPAAWVTKVSFICRYESWVRTMKRPQTGSCTALVRNILWM